MADKALIFEALDPEFVIPSFLGVDEPEADLAQEFLLRGAAGQGSCITNSAACFCHGQRTLGETWNVSLAQGPGSATGRVPSPDGRQQVAVGDASGSGAQSRPDQGQHGVERGLAAAGQPADQALAMSEATVRDILLGHEVARARGVVAIPRSEAFREQWE